MNSLTHSFNSSVLKFISTRSGLKSTPRRQEFTFIACIQDGRRRLECRLHCRHFMKSAFFFFHSFFIPINISQIQRQSPHIRRRSRHHRVARNQPRCIQWEWQVLLWSRSSFNSHHIEWHALVFRRHCKTLCSTPTIVWNRQSVKKKWDQKKKFHLFLALCSLMLTWLLLLAILLSASYYLLYHQRKRRRQRNCDARLLFPPKGRVQEKHPYMF